MSITRVQSFVNLLDLDSLERICIAVCDISANFEGAQRTILRGHNREGDDELSGGGLKVIPDGERVVKICISQHKGKGRRVGRVGRPSDRDRTSGRGIGGGYRQVRQCRGQRQEEEDEAKPKT